MNQVPTINTTFAFNTYNTEVEGSCILQGQGPYYHFLHTTLVRDSFYCLTNTKWYGECGSKSFSGNKILVYYK
jgi:hypothetical protein